MSKFEWGRGMDKSFEQLSNILIEMASRSIAKRDLQKLEAIVRIGLALNDVEREARSKP
jgi:hypothetical protein